MDKEISSGWDLWQRIQANSVLTIVFTTMLILLLYYEKLRTVYPGLEPLFMFFGQIAGLVHLALTTFCILGLLLLIIRQMRPSEIT